MSKCIWENTAEWDDDEYWECCGTNIFQFSEGGPKENHFKYCPYCGKEIKELITEDGNDTKKESLAMVQ